MESTITTKGQTTIPASVRKALDIKAGDRLIYELGKGVVKLKKHPGTLSLLGSLPPLKNGAKVDLEAEKKAIHNAWATDEISR